MKERPIPPAAVLDPGSIEMLRVWIADRSLHCSMNVGMYKEIDRIPEPHAWGVILADITRHVAAALSEAYGEDVSDTVDEIHASYEREILRPTSPVSGGFVRNN